MSKTNHELDHEDTIRALSALKNDPNFRQYIAMRESMREETIRALQTPEIIADTNRHFYITGKLEAIDEELDTFTSFSVLLFITYPLRLGWRRGFFIAIVKTIYYILLH